MKVPYYCPYCNQRSTRRWNLDVHIKRRHGGYLLGESSSTHMAINPFWYKPNAYHNIATVADSVSDNFQPRYIPQQTTLGKSQDYTSPMYRPLSIMNDRSYETRISPETIHKIDQIKRLAYKYPQYHNNHPDEIVKWAIYCSSSGDNKFLDEMLEQLHTIDSLAKF